MRRTTLDRDVEALRRHGVPMRAIATVCPAPMNIVLDRSGQLYQPDEAGRPAWVFPICCANPDDSAAIEAADPLAVVATGPVIDLLAFSPLALRRWALRRGVATVLGAIEPQYANPDPVPIHRDVTDWLRAGCRGIVLLASEPHEAERVLRECSIIEAEDAPHAAELRRLLTPRPPARPAIRVRAVRRSAA
jgi:hypothetical protein